MCEQDRTVIRVIKVGGSLFDLVDLPDRIRGWLAAQPADHNVLLVGGGPLAEQIRSWNRMSTLADAAAHWMCVDLLAVTAQLLNARLPELTIVDEECTLRERLSAAGTTIFSPASWLRNGERHAAGLRLPWNWDVTSDSISGRLAITLGADELVVLKSSLPRDSTGKLGELAAAGFVDQFLPKMAADLPVVRLVDLRSGAANELVLSA
jgi:aspartokinase-like uncharacterized kinase